MWTLITVFISLLFILSDAIIVAFFFDKLLYGLKYNFDELIDDDELTIYLVIVFYVFFQISFLIYHFSQFF